MTTTSELFDRVRAFTTRAVVGSIMVDKPLKNPSQDASFSHNTFALTSCRLLAIFSWAHAGGQHSWDEQIR
jgi:hypothetical protein